MAENLVEEALLALPVPVPNQFGTKVSSLQTLQLALEIASWIDDPVSLVCSKKVVNENSNDQMENAVASSCPGY